MKPRWHTRWRLLALGADAVFISAALIALAVARFGPQALRDGFDPTAGRFFAQAPLLFGIPVWLAVFAAGRLYSPQRCQNAVEEGRRLITAGLAASLALVLLGFLVKENPARSWLFGGMVVGTVAAAMGRRTVRRIVARKRRRGRWMSPTIVVGRRQAKSVLEALLAEPAVGAQPVGACGFDAEGVTSWPITAIEEAVRVSGACEVVVVAEDLERHEVAAAIEVADALPIHLVVLPGLDHLLLGSLQLVTVGHEPGLAVESPSLRGYHAAIKRGMDVVVSGVVLALTSPLLVAVAAVLRLDSKGSVLFRQPRVGRHGRVFDVVKFRTMREGADPPENPGGDDLGFLSKAEDDARVTRVGRWLRRSSVDELPQLWNVLRGDMSLVGPRPLPLWEAEALDLRRRLIVRPGLTGLWQVSGRSTLPPEERIRLDLVYVQNWNLLLDLSILLRTVPAVVSRRGAF